MTLHWVSFAPAIVLLLFPADRLLSSRVGLRSFDCFNSLRDSPRHRPWWWVLALWLDPMRSAAGVWLLIRSLELEEDFWRPMPKDGYSLFAAIVALSVVGQLYTRRGDRGVMIAPVGFVAGLVLGLTPWTIALPTLVAAGLGLFAFRQFTAFFWCGALALPPLGFALEAKAFWTVPAAVALLLPAVAALLREGSLELPVRADAMS